MTPRQRLSKAREGTLDYMPYLARYVYSLRPVEVRGTGTLGVSKDGLLYWDADFVSASDMGQLTYVVIHEALHLLLRHHARAVECYGEFPTAIQQLAMQVAADLVLEQTMACMRSLAPPNGNRLGARHQGLGITLSFPPNLQMAEYYRLILQAMRDDGRQQPPPAGGESQDVDDGQDDTDAGLQQATPRRVTDQSREGREGSAGGSSRLAAHSPRMAGGSASDGCQRPWETEQDDTWDAFGEVIAARNAEQDIREAQLLNPGWVPGNLLEEVAKFLRPQPDPFEHLRSAVASSVSSPLGGRMSTYRRMSRKQPPDMGRLRGYITTQADAAVIVDTSGSMSDRETKERALQVIADGLRKLRNVQVYCADVRIRSSERLASIDRFQWVGGGGTDMRSVIMQVDRERRPDSIVLVTDAATPWPDRPPRARVVVALTQQSRHRSGIPAWCRVVPLFKEK